MISIYSAGAKVDTIGALVSPSDLSNGLTHYWSLEASSLDSVGGTTGTDTDVTYGSGYGKVGNGASFNGSTSKVENAVYGPTGASVRSVSCWFKAASLADKYVVAYGSAVASQMFAIYTTATGRVQLAFYGGVNDLGAYTAGSWVHVVATYGPVYGLYGVSGAVNGVTAPFTSCNLNTAAAGLTVGIGPYAPIGYFAGDVDEVGVWSRVLTPSEIAALYGAGTGHGYPFSVTGSANGAVITGNVEHLQGATTLVPGLVTTYDQTFAGVKTFAGIISPSLRNTNGSGATDVCVKAGTSVTDGALHAAAKLLSLRTGLSGPFAEVEKMFVNKQGRVEIMTAGEGIVLKSPDGTRYLITVANGGTLAVAAA